MAAKKRPPAPPTETPEPYDLPAIEAAIQAGDTATALKRLAKHRLRLPDSPDGYTIALRLLRDAGRTDDAATLRAAGLKRPAIAAAIAAMESPTPAEANAPEAAQPPLGLLVEQQNWPEARRLYPGDPTGWLQGASAASAAGDLAAAHNLLAEAATRFPEDGVVRIAQGYLAMRQDNHAAAEAAWAEARRLGPDHADGWVHGAMAAFNAGRAEEAETIVQAGLARLPANYTMNAAAAYLAEHRADWQTALARWHSALALADNKAEAEAAIARISAKL